MPKKSASKKARKSKDAAEKTPRSKAKKAPARAGKSQRAKAEAKTNGKARKAEAKAKAKTQETSNGKRMTNKDRILQAWQDSAQLWPPELGDKVRLFVPKDLRGKMAKVIAVGDAKAKESTRVAPKGKARIMLKVRGSEPVQFAVAQDDVFPKEVSLKDLQALS